MSIINNPLHQYTSYNYRWKFGIVGPQNLSRPEVYRENGPDLTIVQSGGFPDKRVTTFAEDALGVNVEYFIDDVRSEYLVVPNPGTSFSNNIQIEFKVYEPLSVGLFFQSLRLACEQLYGVSRGYLDVPFILQCDFVGYDDAGNEVTGIGKHTLALSLVNVTFNVDQSGAVYHVTAIPWNHQALMDQTQSIRTDITMSGDTVEGMLHGSPNSLVAELNRQEEELEKNANGQAGAKIAGNRYHIVFPKEASQTQPNLNLNTININSNGFSQGSFNNSDDYQSFLDNQRQARQNNYYDDAILRQARNSGVIVSTASATDSGSVNYIGRSQIIQDFAQYGNNPFGVEGFVFDEGSDAPGDEVYTRGPLTIDANNREFTFKVGTKIEKIISQVILSSDWGLNLVNQVPNDRGNVYWFKIHVETHIRNLEEMKNSGKPAYDFYYIVTPYEIDASKVAPAWQNQDYTPKVQECVKAYHYMYTGLNSDIINFEFNIDNAFYKELARTTQGREDTQHNAGSSVSTQPVDAFIPNAGTNDGSQTSDMGSTSAVTAYSSESGGNGASTSKRDVANLFQRAVLNSDTDMITLDLKIWGDPYYFMDSDCGNYRTPNSGNPNMTADGKIDPTRNECYVLVQFRTAVDYNGSMLQLDPTNQFSGIYKIVTFHNNFVNGMFTQELHLVRLPNQSIDSVENSNSVVSANIQGNLPLVLSNLREESQLRSAEFQSLVRQAEELEKAFTLFSQQGIQNFEDILQGTQLYDLAQNLGGAFNQLATLQNNLSTTLNLIQGGLPNLIENAARNAISRSPVGQAVKTVTKTARDIRNLLGS